LGLALLNIKPLTPKDIATGTWVNSYLLHAEPVGYETKLILYSGSYEFDEPILGVIITETNLEISDGILGRDGTTYEDRSDGQHSGLDFFGDTTRGIQDIITISGNTVTLNIKAADKMDEVRVITLASVKVDIDIKPGSYPNAVNINGSGVVPVAILGSEDFDVSQIDPATLSFGGLSVKTKKKGSLQYSIKDVSGDFSNTMEGEPDGYLDIVCQFVDEDGVSFVGNGTAKVEGNLYDGTPILGEDEIKLIKK
jgi:hypothetical protein